MKTILAFLILSVTSYAQPALYPLHIGDMWQYRYSVVFPPDPTVYSSKITGDTIIGGVKYAVIQAGILMTQDLVRQSGDSVFVYNRALKKELLYYNFSSAVGDTISTTPFEHDTMDIVLSQKYTENYFGPSRRFWVFAINHARHSIDDELLVTVADSIGITNVIPGFGDPMVLSGAIIDGIKYGTVLGLRREDSSPTREFILWQNYPNPFNPKTIIKLALPQSSPVSIEVYNVIGKLVKRLDYSLLPSGIHELQFDASQLSSGNYYYRVNTLNEAKTGRMLLLK
jgi:hypothetical protein